MKTHNWGQWDQAKRLATMLRHEPTPEADARIDAIIHECSIRLKYEGTQGQ
jgi:hypothetical protein